MQLVLTLFTPVCFSITTAFIFNILKPEEGASDVCFSRFTSRLFFWQLQAHETTLEKPGKYRMSGRFGITCNWSVFPPCPQYGYRLPESDEDIIYYSVYFQPLGPTLYTYPSICVRPTALLFLKCTDNFHVLQNFLADIRQKIPSICGKPFGVDYKVGYAVPKHWKCGEVSTTSRFKVYM